MSKGEKNYSISLIRLIATISIICCHSLEYSAVILGEREWILRSIGNYCANGVQVFLLLSGFLYGRRSMEFQSSIDRIIFIKRNFWKILRDYWLYCFMVIIPVYYFLHLEAVTVSSIVGVLVTADTIWGVHHLWFIAYILLCYLITPFLYDIKKYLLTTKISYVLGVLSLLLLTEWLLLSFKSFFVPEWICCYMIGFFAPEMKENRIK